MILPDSLTNLGWGAFAYTSLTSINIPNGINAIRECMFYDSTLEKITIGSGVSIIEDGAFHGCNHLTSISVDKNNTVYQSIGNCIVEKATQTLVICCSTGVIPADESITSIGDCAFEPCSSLTNVTIPSNITSIGSDAFYVCWYLTSITYGGTKAQWKDIVKNVDMDGDHNTITVHCTDGDITVEHEEWQ